MMEALATATYPAVERYLLSASALRAASDPLDLAVDHIVCGDSLDLLASFPSESIDLVHTSPPYNIDKPYRNSGGDLAPAADYEAFLEVAIAELKRVLKPGGSIFWQTGYTQNGDGVAGIAPIDFISYELFRQSPNPTVLWDRIIWRYWGGHAFTRKFTNKHETILWFVKPGAAPKFSVDAVRERAKEYDKRNNFWGRNPGNVWEVDRVAFGSTEQTSHIAVFPEELTERIVRACSDVGDVVLDPFLGSGTVAKVARGLGRRWIGVEISPDYAAEAAQRVGFQQPGEADSLASGLIKTLGFGGRLGVRRIEDLAVSLSRWAGNVRLGEAREALEADVAAVFADGSGRNLMKRDTWLRYDEVIDAGDLNNPIVLADRLLADSYRLRQRFNGVSRYRSSLDALESVTANLTDAKAAQAYVSRILHQEPSAYAVGNGSASLLSAERRVATSGAASAQESEHLDGETLQKRLEL